MTEVSTDAASHRAADRRRDAAGLSRRQALVAALLVGLCVLVVRALVVFAFGSSTPFWDQWGAEAARLYRPMLLDQFDVAVLWEAHNEHRIGLTRLIAMALFELNERQWDCRVAALVNAFVYMSGAALLAGLVARHVQKTQAVVLCLVVALVGLLPYGWENTVSSFQVGFHLLFALTVALLWVVASRAASWATALVIVVLVALLHFTIASNLFVLAAAIGVAALRGMTRDLPWRAAAALAAPLVAGLVAAVVTFPRDVPNPVAATSAKAVFDAWMVMANWPAAFPAVVLFALPCVLVLVDRLRRREYRPMDGLFAALYGIGVLTCVAAAWNRGHNLIEVTSRYADMLALAGISPVYFALTRSRAASPLRRWSGDALGFAAAATFLVGLVVYSIGQWPQMQQRRTMLVAGTGHARGHLDGNAKAIEGKQQLYALYPFPGYIPNALDDPLTRAILPLSLFAPGPRLSQQSVTACACSAAEPDADGRPEGRIVCDGHETPGRIRVGRLTALGYRLWQALDLRPLPELKPAAFVSPQAGETCSLDLVNLDWVPANKRLYFDYLPALRLIGWSIHKGAAPDAPLEFMLSSPEATYALRASVNAVRPELEMFHKDPTHTRGGFDFDVDTAAVPPGNYRVFLRRGDAPFCDSQVTVNIARATDARLLY